METDLFETKILLNSMISDTTSGARFLSIDLKYMFLHTPMDQPEYMKDLIKDFPNDIKEKYHLEILEQHGYIYISKSKKYVWFEVIVCSSLSATIVSFDK